MIFYIFFIILALLATYCAIQISITDFRHRIIPDKYLFPLMLIGLCFVVFFPYPIEITNAVLGGIFGYTTTATIGFLFEKALNKKSELKHPPIGMGDIKLIGVGGLWLGVYGLSLALIIACITGAIWAYIHHTKYIPFGPFFLLGGFLSFITTLFLL